ncbi:hypothetical protein ABW09_22020 [Pluralibacter gergoviae]|nr:hypothetical protein ABW09_22020 [Pluralibacter gergoviae]
MQQHQQGAWCESERARYRARGYWVNQPLGEQLRQWASAQPQRIALVAGAHRLSYADLDALADRLAAGFSARGIRAGDNVMLQLPNMPGLVASLFALFRLGARPVLAMPGQKASDIDALCAAAQPKAWLYPDRYPGNDYQALATTIAARHPQVQRWQIATDDPLMVTYQQAAQHATPPHAEDVALLLLSGGSTGTPKLIPRTHADYYYNAREMAAICGLSAQSVYLATLAVAHNFTLSCPGVLGTLLSGGKVVLALTSGCDEAFELIAQEKVTFTALVPPLVNLWLECREWDDSDLSSLTLIQVGGARLESALAAKVKPAFGCQLQQVFGMAEGLICCTRLDDPDEVILHTQGRPISPADQLRIVDSDDAPVADGEAGELLTRGPYTIRGYYRAGAQNQLAFTPEGFYRSGDIVRLTAAGNLVVEGRLKELINRAGEKIACAEIESLITACPGVSACVVVGVADARLGERICACLSGDGTLSLADLRGTLLGRGLSAHKLPDQLLMVPRWPLTAVGKIDKRRLAALAQQARGAPGECTLPLAAPPLDVVCHLLADEKASHIAYEQQGRWRVGIGSAAEVRVYADRAELALPGQPPLTWRGARWRENLQQALDALPFSDWQAFGCGHFELSALTYHLPFAPTAGPLLTLFIPRWQLTLTADGAALKAHDAAELPLLEARLREADRPAAAIGEDEAWRERIAQRIRQQDADGYRQRVAAAVAEIARGEYQKVILSRRIEVDDNIDLLASFRLGRQHNTPARAFAVRLGEEQFVGFSPETVVEVSAGGAVSTQPLAGTRALTADEAENRRLREVLTGDTKEIAEHAVSVKLAFEELAPLCEEGSTRVSDFMSVSLRGSVQHLASRVEGQLRAGCSGWDAFAALFPAVTASGIPKAPAIAAIRRLEPTPRGAYSGSVFWLSSKGELDAALVLRSLYRRDGGYSLQAGAGIIDQSQPARELEETVEKLESVSRFLVRAR